MATATIFKGFAPVENKSLLLITKDIKEGGYQNEVEKLRALIKSGADKKIIDRQKRSLPAFTPCGTFRDFREAAHLVQYSQFIVLDLDKLSADQFQTAFTKASSINYTFCCFRSPSGNGLKILVEVTSTQEYHRQAFEQVADYYEQQLGLSIDRSGKDITRLCFVSYDPDTHRNIENEKFPVLVPGQMLRPSNQQPVITKAIATDEPNAYSFAFDMQVAFTDQKSQYVLHNRNNYIYLLASNCNRVGIPEADTLELCLQHYDLEPKEMRAAVKSAYGHHTAEHAKFANPANPLPPEEVNSEDFLKTTPSIPEELYLSLPEILKQGAQAFQSTRERDVFLTGALGILSGCLPKIKGVYDQEEVYPNLFTFIIAPAASGKGALKFAKWLAQPYHERVLKNSRVAEKEFQQIEEMHKLSMKGNKGKVAIGETPEKPLSG